MSEAFLQKPLGLPWAVRGCFHFCNLGLLTSGSSGIMEYTP